MRKKIAILGSTGSIGTQALQVIDEHKDKYEAYLLTANERVETLIEQSKKHLPQIAIIANESKFQQLKKGLEGYPIKVYAGPDAIVNAVQETAIDMILTAMVGYAGLRPTIAAIKSGKNIALANKETLVVAGELINKLKKVHNVSIYPVDSEHSAIFQCLAGESATSVSKLILTASGGPFRTYSLEQMKYVTKQQALKHPNWSMGAKITIDSATMMNKGFEVIEAKWLFDISPEQIEVVVHPQSIIHSMVEFHDGSIKAQLGMPDMRLPIQYAFSYPNRLNASFPRLNWKEQQHLTFETPDTVRFPNLRHAYEALKTGGNMPCIINAANEVAVEAFLKEKISFMDISRCIETAMQQSTYIAEPTYDDYVATDKETRIVAENIIQSF